jgi:hypothetical protein
MLAKGLCDSDRLSLVCRTAVPDTTSAGAAKATWGALEAKIVNAGNYFLLGVIFDW